MPAIFPMSIAFNAAMLVVDATVLILIARRPQVIHATKVIAAAGAFAAILAVGLAEHSHRRWMGIPVGFGTIRLTSHAIFFHGPLLALGVAVIFRGQRLLAGCAAAVGLLLAGVGFDAFFIEPTWLEVTHRTIESPAVAKPVRIVVLADIQTDKVGEYERSCLRRAMAEKPDLLLFAGDYVQTATDEEKRAQAKALHDVLTEIGIPASANAFAIRGNTESDDWGEIFRDLPVKVIERTETFSTNGITLTCLSEDDSFRTSTAVKGQAGFHLVLGHCPNFARGDVDADLLIAGHTHGGQVRIPILGLPLMTLSRIPRAWGAGMREIEPGKRLFVSRGTGMERWTAPRLRFCCRPELAVIDLSPRGTVATPRRP